MSPARSEAAFLNAAFAAPIFPHEPSLRELVLAAAFADNAASKHLATPGKWTAEINAEQDRRDDAAWDAKQALRAWFAAAGVDQLLLRDLGNIL